MTRHFIIDNLKRIGWLLLVVLIGTALDYAVHSLNIKFAVPEYYFRNKIIFATLLLDIGLFLFWRIRSASVKSVLVTAFFAILLQARYAITGYPLWFVFFFMVVHFAVFMPPLYGVFRFRPNLFNIST